MAYNFVEKVSHEQQENAYILYMIIGSYFNKCICKSKMIEMNLMIYYKEMRFGKQERKEQLVIKAVEQIFGRRKSQLADLNCEAIIARDGSDYKLVFYTGFEEVIAAVDKNGKYQIELVAD